MTRETAGTLASRQLSWVQYLM